jgi:membrane-bound lytic murein transglycosylase D
MNKSLLFSILFFAASLVATTLMLTSANNSKKTESQKPLVLSMTASVEVPESMYFAGEKITFDRYDKHERMDRELNSFTYFHSTTLLLFKRANRIFPIIEPILKQQGLPDDLKYLAVIESNLDPRAISSANAVGLWQFLQSTGRQYGLEVSSEVDERYHLEKSTVAACRFLKEAYNKFGSWSAAAMSYNGGQARITKSLADQRAEEALDLWLVEETTRYYYRMLAIKQIFEQPQQYGFILKPSDLYKPMEFKEMNVTTSIPDLASFAQENGITYAQLKDFNSWLRSTKLTNTSGKSYTILIPTKESLFYNKKDRSKVHNQAWVVK